MTFIHYIVMCHFLSFSSKPTLLFSFSHLRTGTSCMTRLCQLPLWGSAICRCWWRIRDLLLPLSFLFVFCPWEHHSSLVSLQNLSFSWLVLVVVLVGSKNSHRIHREFFPIFAEPVFSHPTAYNTSWSYRLPSDQRSGVPTPQGPASAQRCQPQLNSTPPQRSEFFSSVQTLLLSFNNYSLFVLTALGVVTATCNCYLCDTIKLLPCSLLSSYLFIYFLKYYFCLFTRPWLTQALPRWSLNRRAHGFLYHSGLVLACVMWGQRDWRGRGTFGKF